MSNHHQHSDQELIALIKGGDHLAFNEIYKRYYRPLFIFAYHLIHDKEDCDDIVQDVLSWFWEHRDQHTIENLKAYLRTAVKYQVAKFIRKGKVRQNHLLANLNLDTEILNEESLELQELKRVISSFIHQLPEKASEIFRMSREEHLTNKEIATKLGVSEGTVAVQIKRALDKLRKKLGSMHFWIYFFV